MVIVSMLKGIDYTASNEYQGRTTFEGRSLHHTGQNLLNPYQQVNLIQFLYIFYLIFFNQKKYQIEIFIHAFNLRTSQQQFDKFASPFYD